MIRSVIQWLICQKIDNDAPLGWWLSQIVRHDVPTRRYYEDLLRLGNRLRHDAEILLEDTTRTPTKKPLHVLARSSYKSKRRIREKTRNSFAFLALSVIFIFGAGAFFNGWIVPFVGSGHVVASPSTGSSVSPDTTMLHDPQINEELIRLCRRSPNESGPFFVDPM